jgi:cysteine desulfuration protein SufE
MGLKGREKSIIDDFNFFQNWDEKYEYIISLGKEVSNNKTNLKSPENLIKGCQSNVWLSSSMRSGKVFFFADSDALITKGLVALLLKIFSNAKPKEIALFELSLINEIGLNKHLSMTRSNGLGKMIEKIKKISLNYLKE